MPMYWDAYIADTTHLSCEEHGAYLMLLGAMWRRNGWVPDDDKDNARILGLTVARWKRIKARLAVFLVIENDHITQKKLLETWENTQEKIAKNKLNGAKGGRAAASKINDLDQANATVSVKPKATIPEPEPEPYKRDTNVSPKNDLFGCDKVEPDPKPETVRLPPDWSPNDVDIEYALSKQIHTDDIREMANDFQTYWSELRGAKGRKSRKGWAQCWRNHVNRNAATFIRNRRMAQQAGPSGYGQGGGIAGAVARRRTAN